MDFEDKYFGHIEFWMDLHTWLLVRLLLFWEWQGSLNSRPQEILRQKKEHNTKYKKKTEGKARRKMSQ